MKRNTNKSRSSNRNKRNSIRKVSNIFKKSNFLIELWQFLFFSSISILLIFTYLNQAWKPINFDNIEIKGISGIKKNDIKKATRKFFPKNLVELNPKEIESYLLKNLPIKEISITRNFFPPGINLILQEREPIAFATRVSSNNTENGMIDLEGNWIPLEFITQEKKNNTVLFIENWNKHKKNDITKIIKNRFLLQTQLKKITLSPLQEISIETEHFNSVLIGSNTDRLIEQINKLNQLQKSLPNLLINTKVTTVDLKDPSEPELKTERNLSR